VCTGHCTVQCPVHRQPRAQNPFSCAMSGGSPDSYCALSGVHRTGTVDCPVRPYSVFKKSFPARARGRDHFLCLSPLLLNVSGVSTLAGDSPSPATTVLRRSSVLVPALSLVSSPASPLHLFFSSLSVSAVSTPFHPFVPNSISYPIL
jgi:hypothetical protein